MQNIVSASIVSEFADLTLGDKRLSKRAVLLASALAAQPNASIPQATGSAAQACAAYRFLDNPNVPPPALLTTHSASTIQRAAALPLALAINDTTTLNYSERPNTTGLGPIGNNADKTLGLHQHGLLAFSPEREPLGVLDATYWARDPAKFGSKHQRHRRPIEEKESAKWLASYRSLLDCARQTPSTQWVFVADREADIYDLFLLASTTASTMDKAPALLVRMQQDRCLDPNEHRLFAHLGQAPVVGQLHIHVPRRKQQPERTATLTIRCAAVRLPAPKKKREQPVLSLWAIEARELHPPKGVEALHWRLLSSCEVKNFSQAVEKIGWYCIRWGIEVFHKVLKSGCGVEAAQLESAERLERYVRIKLVIAWQVMALSYWGRAHPEAAISEILEETQWKLLQEIGTKGSWDSERVPTVREGIRWLGRLGGHLGRRGDGEPGPLILARGIQRLHDITTGWQLAQRKDVRNV